MSSPPLICRAATIDDLEALIEIEALCFSSDKLSRRSFRHHIKSLNSDLLVAQLGDPSNEIIAYGLVLNHQGTRLARLYSIAIHPERRGKGAAKQLLTALETAAVKRGKLFMRLEVATNNQPAIQLYQAMDYRVFGEYSDYYEDHSDALRMQKCIRGVQSLDIKQTTPWYQQTTDFTCGPAALMMAMASLRPEHPCTQSLELEIWREATTVFMTSGHGGCHPLGLALAARKRGFPGDAGPPDATPAGSPNGAGSGAAAPGSSARTSAGARTNGTTSPPWAAAAARRRPGGTGRRRRCGSRNRRHGSRGGWLHCSASPAARSR